MKLKCVYWADSLQDKIWRLCMDGKSLPQILVESQLGINPFPLFSYHFHQIISTF